MKMQDPEVGGVVVAPAPAPAPSSNPIKVGFSGPMRMEYAEYESGVLGKDYWRVLTAFTYTTPSGEEVRVPRGYLSDGASVPRPFWNLIPPMGPYGQAAVIHDILCETARVFVHNDGYLLNSRADVDRIFKDAMLSSQTPRWKRNVMYIFLRVYAKVCKPPVPKPDAHKTWLMNQWLKDHPQEY